MNRIRASESHRELLEVFCYLDQHQGSVIFQVHIPMSDSNHGQGPGGPSESSSETFGGECCHDLHHTIFTLSPYQLI